MATSMRQLRFAAALGAAGCLLVAGCGGSDSTTATVPGTTVEATVPGATLAATVPGTTVEVPPVSSVVESATSVAGEAAPSGSSVADDLRQQLSNVPGLDAVIDDVQIENGTVTVHTSLTTDDMLAGVAKQQCASVRRSMGERATRLVILGADGSTIASC
jgi:hypothetical protein